MVYPISIQRCTAFYVHVLMHHSDMYPFDMDLLIIGLLLLNECWFMPLSSRPALVPPSSRRSIEEDNLDPLLRLGHAYLVLVLERLMLLRLCGHRLTVGVEDRGGLVELRDESRLRVAEDLQLLILVCP